MKIAIGTFNTRNLSLPEIEYYPGEKYSQKDYELKKKWLARQIDLMDCDIIGFQEVFHEAALRDVLSTTKLNGYQLFFTGTNTLPLQPSLALVSKYPLKNSQIIADIPIGVSQRFEGYSTITSFSRAILQAEIELGENKTLTILVSHLKSKNPSFLEDEKPDKLRYYHLAEARSLIRRTVEAAGLRQMIVNLIRNNNTPLMILGDLNDTTRAVTSEIIGGPNPYKYLPRQEKTGYWDLKMYSVFDILAQMTLANNWFTHIYDGKYEILDHIYLSEEFYFRNEKKTWDVDYLKIFNDHLADETNTKENLSNSNSDHGQVVVHLRSIT